jgi:DNA N-6-adenine-methyltransferase (Dam)
MASMGGHESPSSVTQTWLTPPSVLRALGAFDLDPCACPDPRPWATAATHWTREDGPLRREWHGRVWLNPPYGTAAQVPWLARMAEHAQGTALLFARTETAAFHAFVWDRAHAVLFLRGRLVFHRQDGSLPYANAGAPSVLVAYGPDDAARLQVCGLSGRFLGLHQNFGCGWSMGGPASMVGSNARRAK